MRKVLTLPRKEKHVHTLITSWRITDNQSVIQLYFEKKKLSGGVWGRCRSKTYYNTCRSEAKVWHWWTTHSGREIIIWSDGRTSSFARSIGTPWLHLSQQQSGNNDRNIVLGSQDSLAKRFVHGTTRTQALDLKTLGIYNGGLWMPGIFSN